jgi:tetratricopeptide (TPR) repeat protein
VKPGLLLLRGRRYDEAIEKSLSGLELWGPVCPAEDHFIASSYVAKGMPAEAISRVEKAIERFGRIPRLLGAQAEAYAAAGRRQEVEEILQELRAAAEEQYVDPTLLAWVHLVLGNHNAAFEMLERAYEDRAQWLPFIAVDPKFDPLRSDPRFDDLLRRIGLQPVQLAGQAEAA